jgi:hypothetical protein
MEQGDRRIRRLKLRGPDEEQLLQLRYGLEEAFRIASLPGLPVHATVLIRRLDLGKIRSGLAAVHLAEGIAETVRGLAASAICIDEASPGNADVVWFSDPLLPYQLLLQRLLDGKPADEWYWRSIYPGFPGGEPGLNEELIAGLFDAACQAPQAGMAVPLLLQSALAPTRLSRLLPLLTPALARRMLSRQGMSPLAMSPPGGAAMTPRARRSAQAAAAFGPLIEAPNLALAWRGALRLAVGYWGCEDVRCRWLALQALFCYRPAYLDAGNLWHRIQPDRWLHSWYGPTPGDSVGAHSLEQEVGRRKAKGPGHRKHAAGEPHAHATTIPDVSMKSNQVSEPDSRRAPGITLERVDPGTATTESSAPVTHPGYFSHHAGFALLIPLLQRLQLRQLLQSHETLLALDFPRQLLSVMASRFELDVNDPCRRLLLDVESTPGAVVAPWRAPPAWARLLNKAGSSRRHVCLRANTLTVAELIDSVQLLCALFLRRHCDLSLRALIQRYGRVAVSSTHWDVAFDINQTDLRLRRLALDADPGWVPWLGRVVTFHYRNEEQTSG